jgi:hypothetical protein
LLEGTSDRRDTYTVLLEDLDCYGLREYMSKLDETALKFQDGPIEAPLQEEQKRGRLI